MANQEPTQTYRVEIRFDVTGTSADAWAVGMRAARMFGGEITEVTDEEWVAVAETGTERTAASDEPIIVIEMGGGLIQAVMSTDASEFPVPVVFIDYDDIPEGEGEFLPADDTHGEDEVYASTHLSADAGVSPRMKALVRRLVAEARS